MNWLYVKHAETGGTASIPDEDGVLNWYTAHGWDVADPPEDSPYVPPADGGQSLVGEDFVTLKHSETGAEHEFPANDDAIAGAHDVGWRFPEELKVKPPTKPKSKSDAEPVTDKSESEKS